jgi:hypothetical protein
MGIKEMSRDGILVEGSRPVSGIAINIRVYCQIITFAVVSDV